MTARILLIDDEDNFRKIVKRQLATLDGHELHEAPDGTEGLQMARMYQFDLVLLDWDMPGMDGLEVLKELKTSPATDFLPVYMLTVERTMGHVEDALELDVDGYITKPISMPKLSEKVHAILKELGKE